MALALAGALLAGAAAAQDAASGAALAQARGCGACHGAQVLPRTPAIAGQHADFTVLQLVLMREGLRRVPAMQPAVAGLSDAQIEDLAAHYASLPPAAGPAAPRDEARAAEGARLSAAMNCGTCHLPSYAGRANIPRIAGQREDFLAHTLREYRDNIRVGADTQMNGAMHGVTDAQIAALAHYLAQR
jgi:cytochrome c553